MEYEEYEVDGVAKLVLNTCNILPDLSPSALIFPESAVYSNNVGTITRCLTDITWKNINMKELLGTLWDKYDYFNLELVNALTFRRLSPATDSLGTATDNTMRTLNIFIEGLDWVNSSFNVATGNNRSLAYLGNMNINGSGLYASNRFSIFPETYALCNLKFRKSSQYVNIRITLSSMSSNTTTIPDGTCSNVNKTFPPSAYVFNIIPCYDD